MNRRTFLGAGLSAPFLARSVSADGLGGGNMPLDKNHPLQDSWRAWKSLCLSHDGRVIDGFQKNSSHSEGQGYGLTLAAFFDDENAAAQIISWTERNLNVREDELLAWRWMPDAAPHVTDRNNASDGDLFYAWGLSNAAALGQSEARIERARMIMRDLLQFCVAEHPDGSGRPVLLPGATGFRVSEGLVINLSYPMGRALRDLARSCGLPQLARLADSSDQLIAELASKGPLPDWVLLTASGAKAAPPPFSRVSGYEAMRVPLFALWSGLGQSEAVRRYSALMNAAGTQGGTPTVFSLQGHSVTERSSHAGYAAVAALAACASTNSVGSIMPGFTTDQPYYPATLHLMALVAQVSTFPRCVPI